MSRDLRGPFRFDPASHRYTVGARPVPGIHAVLRAGGVERDLGFLSDEYRLRGKAVHAATLHWELTGDEPHLRPEWRPFFEAYRAFRQSLDCRWRWLEHPRVERRLGFASIIDREGTVNGGPAILEIKTGSPDNFHGPQLAGGDLLAGRFPRGARRRLAVYLAADGKFRLREYSDPADYLKFLAALERWWEAEDGRDHGLVDSAPVPEPADRDGAGPVG